MSNPEIYTLARGRFCLSSSRYCLLTLSRGVSTDEGHRIRNIVLVHVPGDGSGWKAFTTFWSRMVQRQHRPGTGNLLQRRRCCHEASSAMQNARAFFVVTVMGEP